MRDFLNFWIWQLQKRSDSASLPQFFTLTTSKTKQFCETSFKNGKLSAEVAASYQCVLRFFRSSCLKYCACHEKWGQVIRSAAPITQNHLRKPEDLMLQNATHLRKSAPGPPNISDEHVSCTAPAARKTSCQILCKCPHACHRFRKCYKTLQNPHVLLAFDKVHNPLRLPRKTTSERPKVLRTHHFFTLLTSTCASCRSGVHFFDVSTSKSGPSMVWFVHFDLDMCFAPQPRALFRHLNFQKRPEREARLAFSLANALSATTACNFSSLIWSHGSAPAAWASLLFDPSKPQIIGKTQNRDFATFSRTCVFLLLILLFSDLLSSSLLWLFPPLLFHLSILSEVWLLSFLRLSLFEQPRDTIMISWIIWIRSWLVQWYLLVRSCSGQLDHQSFGATVPRSQAVGGSTSNGYRAGSAVIWCTSFPWQHSWGSR